MKQQVFDPNNIDHYVTKEEHQALVDDANGNIDYLKSAKLLRDEAEYMLAQVAYIQAEAQLNAVKQD